MTLRVKITGPLNGTQLGDAVAAELGLPREEGRQAATTVLDLIARAVAGGHPVNVTNFGTWLPVHLPSRDARNPATGESVVLPARQEIRFRVSPRLRDLVQEAKPDTATIRKHSKS